MSEPLKTRSELRKETVQLVNGLSRKELLALVGISRVADLTGMDAITVPVYTCVRALSKTISIHAGKGLDRQYARAGAILEAMEFEAGEHPVGKFNTYRAAEIPAEDRLEIMDCFPARSSTVNDFTILAWEEATDLNSGAVKLVPSDLLWLTTRIAEQPLMYLQMGSNGLAAGGSVEDAILSGLYEVLERDAWTLNQFCLDSCGIMPVRCPLAGLPERIDALVRKIERAKIKLHLFDISNDYKVPVYSAILIDLGTACAGTFGGYGAHLNAEIAAIRAITEAIQARACYISGARDDLFRRQFLQMKRMNQQNLDKMFSELPLGAPLTEYRTLRFDDVKSELRYLLRMIKGWGVSEVYAKTLGSFLDGRIQVVRVFSPQCEPFKFDHWTAGLRCLSYAQRRMKALAEVPSKNSETDEEGEEWRHAT